jgi:transposase
MADSRQSRIMARSSALHERFTDADRRRLTRALEAARAARVYRRLAAVLAVADGKPLSVVAQQARSARSSVQQWVERYLAQRDPAALGDAPRPGRPRRQALTTQQLVRLLARDPRTLGYQATTWTAALLTTYCAERYQCRLHPRTMRRRLHDLGYRWKRPRYRFVHRAPHLAQKKGLSDAS